MRCCIWSSSLLAIAVIFYLLGAPFAGALEVVIYAGAIMVLFVFVVMMLNQGRRSVDQERALLSAAHVDRTRGARRRCCSSK